MFQIAPYIWYALLSALFAALTALFAKMGLKQVNSDLATAIRTAIILLITWGIVLFKGSFREIPALSKNTWLFLTLSAFATGLSWLFYYKALQIGRVTQVTAIDKGSIVFTILLAALFLGETITPRIALGVVLIFGGMLVMIWK